jgi:hypothetical protein
MTREEKEEPSAWMDDVGSNACAGAILLVQGLGSTHFVDAGHRAVPVHAAANSRVFLVRLCRALEEDIVSGYDALSSTQSRGRRRCISGLLPPLKAGAGSSVRAVRVTRVRDFIALYFCRTQVADEKETIK